MSLKSLKYNCRCCLKGLQRNISFPIEGYFEDLFCELQQSTKLSQKVCLVCNSELTTLSGTIQRFKDNQWKLNELIGIHRPPDLAEVSDSEKFTEDIFIKEEAYDEPIVKSEPVEVVCVKNEIKQESSTDENSDDDCVEVAYEQPSRRQFFISQPKKKPDHVFCPKCDKRFATKKNLRIHVEAVHEKIKKFKCNMDGCEYMCYTTGNMVIHQQNVHKVPWKNSYVCEFCAKAYNTSTKLNNHRNMTHLKIKNVSCDICGGQFYQKKDISQHMRIHCTDRVHFRCDFPGCKVKSYIKNNIAYHKKAVHDKIRDHPCACGKKFPFSWQLISHQKSHGAERFECDICKKVFKGSKYVELHKTKLHPHENCERPVEQPKLPCDVCGIFLSSLISLKNHRLTHEEPKFECDQCDKKFFRKNALQDHQEHHTTLEFPCQQCKRSYRMESRLQHHLRTVHFKPKRTYRCELCSSTFTRRTTCRDHVIKQHPHLETNFKKALLERIANMLPEETTGTQN